MSYDIDTRCGSDPALLWLWRRLAGTALIRLLAWKPPYAGGVALKRKKKKKKTKRKVNSPASVMQNSFFKLFFFWIVPHPWYMEVPGLGVKLEL